MGILILHSSFRGKPPFFLAPPNTGFKGTSFSCKSPKMSRKSITSYFRDISWSDRFSRHSRHVCREVDMTGKNLTQVEAPWKAQGPGPRQGLLLLSQIIYSTGHGPSPNPTTPATKHDETLATRPTASSPQSRHSHQDSRSPPPNWKGQLALTLLHHTPLSQHKPAFGPSTDTGSQVLPWGFSPLKSARSGIAYLLAVASHNSLPVWHYADVRPHG
jgi:hypothetical protein